VKFKTHDTIKKIFSETEIRPADLITAHLFVQTWVGDVIVRCMKNPHFAYTIFPWDRIIRASFIVGATHTCFAAYTDTRLDGLLSLTKSQTIRIDFIATAPWNYYVGGKMRGIGAGLVFYTIHVSRHSGFEGEFFLYAVPDAERYYSGIGMVPTGKANQADLKEFRMPKAQASAFASSFGRNLLI